MNSSIISLILFLNLPCCYKQEPRIPEVKKKKVIITMSKHAHVEIESIYGGFDATWWIFYSFILSMIFTCIYLAYCNSYRNESQLLPNLFENLERRYFERF